MTFKNYKWLVPISIICIFGLSFYSLNSAKANELKDYNANLELAREKRELEIWDYAELYYLEALSNNNSLELYKEIGEFYLETDLVDKNIKWADKFIETYPKEIEAYEYAMKTNLKYNNEVKCFNIYDKACKMGCSSKRIEELFNEIQYSYYVSLAYDDVSVYSNDLCAVYNGSKWGYVDVTGNQVIEHKFNEAGAFSSEVASVVDHENRVFFIDTDGNKKIVIKNIENLQKLGFCENDIFTAYDGKSWKFYDINGKELFGDYDDCSSLGNGVAAVCKDKKWALIDSDGKELTDYEFQGFISDEKGIVYRCDRSFAMQDGKYYLIDRDGKKISEDSYQNACLFNADGYAAVEIDGKWGFIDTKGKVIIEPQYLSARSFSNGYAAVNMGNAWGFIDLENNLIIEPQFEAAKDFSSNGTVFVKQNETWRMLTLYLYNHKGDF